MNKAPAASKRNPDWEPIDQPTKEDVNYDPRAIREEYFNAADPRDTWKYGLVGTLINAILCLAFFEQDTCQTIFIGFVLIWVFLFAFIIVFDHFFIIHACKIPEITNQTTFSYIKSIYKIVNPSTPTNPNGEIQRNLIKYKVTSWKETLWYSRNISGNLLLVDYCRLYQFALYFFKCFFRIINHRHVHSKSTFFFIINSSLCAYVREHQELNKEKKLVDVTTMTFEKVRLAVNNYGIWAKIFKRNLKYRDFDVKYYLDSEKEIVTELQITLRDYDPSDKNLDEDFRKGLPKTTILRPTNEDNRYEIHTFTVIMNTLVAHVNSHVMATFATDLDETDFPLRRYAGTAISGLNNAGLYISMLVTGPISVPIIVNNVNLGYPHFPVVENRVLQQKSQIYVIMRKIFDDKDIVKICHQKKYQDKFEKEYTEERTRLLKIDPKREIPEYDPRFQVTRAKILRSSIANNFAMHGIDHYVHDRFTPIYTYNDYLQYNDVRQHFFGGKWNCDISSSFQKPQGPISEIVYRIVKTWGGQQLYKGFQWTLEQ